MTDEWRARYDWFRWQYNHQRPPPGLVQQMPAEIWRRSRNVSGFSAQR
jgi:hypothetical protein